MPASSQKDDESNYQLMIKIDNVKNIYFLLKAINFQEKATCFATENGLKVTVEDMKCIQASAFIQGEIFQEYNLLESDEPVTFCIDLSVLLECLNIFGAATAQHVNTALKLCYRGHGFPLQLLLEEEGVLTDCSIRTQELEDLLNFDFCPENVVNKVILKSEPLKDIFSVLESTTEMLELLISPEEPYLRLTTIGNTGECQIEIPKDSDIFEAFQCTTTSKSRYRYAHIKPALRSLAISQKTSIRTDENSLLCFQFMAKTEDGHVCFIEYYCLPVTEDD